MSAEIQDRVLQRLRAEPATTPHLIRERIAAPQDVPAAIGALLKAGRIRVKGHINTKGPDATGKTNNADRVPVFEAVKNTEEGDW